MKVLSVNNEPVVVDGKMIAVEEVDIDGKIDKPVDAPTVGKVLRVKQVNDDGTFVCEWADGGSGGVVDDVTVDGTSVVTDGVANIPYSTATTPGAVRIGFNQNYGIKQASATNGTLQIAACDKGTIDTRMNITTHVKNWSITAELIDYAVKAALTDGLGVAYTAEEQSAARNRLSAASKLKQLDFTLTEPANRWAIDIPDEAEEVFWFSHTYHDSSGDDKENGRQTSYIYEITTAAVDATSFEAGRRIFGNYQAKTVDQIYLDMHLVKVNGIWKHAGAVAFGTAAGTGSVLNNELQNTSAFNGARCYTTNTLVLRFGDYVFDPQSQVILLYR